jgi:hypothetical protein
MLQRGLIVAGGVILLLQSLFGAIAILIFDFSTVLDWTTALSLTLAFPLFLIGFISLRAATASLWIFFIAQWIDRCFISVPPQLASPFDWWHGDTLFAGILFVQIGYLAHLRSSSGTGVKSLRTAFRGDS